MEAFLCICFLLSKQLRFHLGTKFLLMGFMGGYEYNAVLRRDKVRTPSIFRKSVIQ